MIDLDHEFAAYLKDEPHNDLAKYRQSVSFHEVMDFADILKRCRARVQSLTGAEKPSGTMDDSGWATLDDVKLPELSEEAEEALHEHFTDSYISTLLSDQSSFNWEDKFCSFSQDKEIDEFFERYIKRDSHYSSLYLSLDVNVVDDLQRTAAEVTEAIDAIVDSDLDYATELTNKDSDIFDLIDTLRCSLDDFEHFYSVYLFAEKLIEWMESVFSYDASCENAKYYLQEEVDNWIAEYQAEQAAELIDPKQLYLSL